MKKTIYIAGKVTGEDVEACRLKFAIAQAALEKLGFDVVNPITVVGKVDMDWDQAMSLCIPALSKCCCIYMLKDSVDSKGAMIELDYAIENNLNIYYELEGIEHGPTIHDLHGQK